MKRVTQITIIACTAILAGYDIIAHFSAGNNATISAVILEWSQTYPMLPFIFGVLCGHLFWPQYISQEG